MKDQVAISVQNVSKSFRLPHEKADSVKSIFVNPFSKDRKRYELQHTLSNVSFEINKGEFFGIVGRNGSGKSTLLKVIAGIYQPNQGKVQVNGRLVPFIELGVGFNPELTGKENTYLNGALMGFSEKEVDVKYQEIVAFAELERFMDQKLKNYSSGMQVRLAFSVATILAESDILIIDEVLAVGDADFQRKCFSYFKKLKKDKKTVIFVSHDMNAVREYCDKAILIDESKVIFSGTSDATAKEYSRLFLPKDEAEEKVIKKSDKWGAGGVDMRNVRLSKNIYKPNDSSIDFSYKIYPEKGYDDELLVGLVIRDEQGNLICGTNSDIIKYEHIINIANGQPVEVFWSIPNIFNDGTFTIDIAADSRKKGELLQWWDEAAEFKVVNDLKTPYLVAPRISLKIKD